MKIKALMAAALSAVMGLSSCNGSDSKLAGVLAGTWEGSTTEMMNDKEDRPDKDGKHKPDKDDKHKKGTQDKADRGKTGRENPSRGDMSRGAGSEMTCTPTLAFVRTDGTNGGTINIAADFTVTKGVESVTTDIPVKATVNGNVSASGTWTVKDGDEIIVNLDPSKTVVDVDTASLVLSYARLTDAPQDSLNTIKERVAANIPDVIKPMLSGKVQKLRKFDDVKIIGNTMTLEAGHNKMTFTKQ